jgi:hypothetical protein
MICTTTIRDDKGTKTKFQGKAKTNRNKNSCNSNNDNITIVKSSSLTMDQCRVTGNAGVGIRIRGPVQVSALDDNGSNGNIFEENGGGNIDYMDSEDSIDDPGSKSNIIDSEAAIVTALRRDSSGSSFRQGDWWCPNCHNPKQIVPGSRNACPRCLKGGKSMGTFLTKEEVTKLNRGSYCVKITNDDSKDELPTWCFDTDNGAWHPYDSESSQKLESAFQSLCQKQQNVSAEISTQQPSPIVSLHGGKYQVNVKTMEQINIETHFLRLVRRKSN